MPTARSGLGAASVDGILHVIGGEDPATLGGWTTDAHEVYDLESGSWESAPSAPLPLHGVPLVSIDGDLYVIGGAWRHGAWSVTTWGEKAFRWDPREV